MRPFAHLNRTHSLARLLTLWNRLIEPDSSVVDPDERELARALSELLLLGITLVIVLLIVAGLTLGIPFRQYGLRVVLIASLYSLLFFSRRGHPIRLGTQIAFACTVVILAISYFAGGTNGLYILGYLVLPILAGALFVPYKRLLLVFIFQIAGILAYAGIVPDIPLNLVLRHPLLLVVTIGLIGIVFNLYFRRFEANRRARLAESEFRFRQMAENSTENFWLLDMQSFGLLYTSPAYTTIWGLPLNPTQFDAQNLMDAVHPEDIGRLRALQESFTEMGAIVTEMEYRIIRPDGEIRWVRTRYFPVKDQDGKVYRMAGITEDTTERRRTEQQALELALERQRVQVITDFIADASHEFRTPLTTIHTSAYLAKRIDDAEKRQMHLSTIQQQADDILRLVEELVTLSSLDGGQPLYLETLPVNAVVQAVFVQLEGSERARGLELSCHLAPDLPPVQCDAEALYIALGEIIDNAVRYTPTGGRIDIHTCSTGDSVTVEIHDTGTGIPETDLPRVFERFFRGDPAHSTRGFGLGLTIAQAIIRQHQGQIAVTSQPGAGTTVTVSLPKAVTSQSQNRTRIDADQHG